MDWIFTYQYELMYSFGALFALFSMMSYIAPAVQSVIERGEGSMDSSENFFEGFESLDLSAIMEDGELGEGETDHAFMSLVEDETDNEEEPQSIESLEQVYKAPMASQAVSEPIKVREKETVLNRKSEENLEEVLETNLKKDLKEEAQQTPKVFKEPVVLEVVQEKSSSEDLDAYKKEIQNESKKNQDLVQNEPTSPAVTSQFHKDDLVDETMASVFEEDVEDLEEEDDDEVIDYFSQSSLDSDMSIEEDEEEKYSASQVEREEPISEPVVDGFAKTSKKTNPSFEPIKKETLTVKESRVEKKGVLKVEPQEMKQDLLILRTREKLSANNTEVLSLNKKRRSLGDD